MDEGRRRARGQRAASRGVLEALARLAPEQRAVVVLRHLLGYTPGQVARLLELPRGTVNSRLRRALDRLADELGERHERRSDALPGRSRTSPCQAPAPPSSEPEASCWTRSRRASACPRGVDRSGLRLALGVAGAALLAGWPSRARARDDPAFRRDVVVRPQARQLPSAPMRLPGGGNLLVRRRSARRARSRSCTQMAPRSMLGRYRDGSSSPHARFVVATAGHRLVALDPHTGKVHWSITAAAPVRGARWSLEPDGPALLSRGLPDGRHAADRRRRRLRRSSSWGQPTRRPRRPGVPAITGARSPTSTGRAPCASCPPTAAERSPSPTTTASARPCSRGRRMVADCSP